MKRHVSGKIVYKVLKILEKYSGINYGYSGITYNELISEMKKVLFPVDMEDSDNILRVVINRKDVYIGFNGNLFTRWKDRISV